MDFLNSFISNLLGDRKRREEEERSRLRDEAQVQRGTGRSIFDQSEFSQSAPSAGLAPRALQEPEDPGMTGNFINTISNTVDRGRDAFITFTKKQLDEPINIPFAPRVREDGRMGFTPREVGSFARDVAQSFPRAIAESTMSLGGLMGTDTPEQFSPDKNDKLARILFGDKPLQQFQYQPEERMSRQIADKVPLPEDFKMPFAVGLSTISAGSDLIPGVGGAKKEVGEEFIEQGVKRIPKLLEPFVEVAKKAGTVEDFKNLINRGVQAGGSKEGFGTYMVDDVLMSLDNEKEFFKWVKDQGFKTEEEAFSALRGLSSEDSTLRPLATTSMGGTDVPSSARAVTSPSSKVTDTGTPSYKYSPSMSSKAISENPGFISTYNNTTKEEPYLKKLLTDTAAEVKGTATTNIKTMDTAAGKILRKIKVDPSYDETKLGDILRGNIVVKSQDAALDVMNRLSNKTEVTVAEDYFSRPNQWGYQGINMNIKTPGGNLAEIQIHTPQTIEIQNALHPLYEKWRHADRVPQEAFMEANNIVNNINTKYTSKVDEAAAAGGGATPPGSGDIPPGAGNAGEVADDFIINDKGKLEKTTKPKYEFDLKSLETEDDVKNMIKEVARQGDESVQTQRRGTISWKETRKMADSLGMTEEEVTKLKPGKIWNAEQADAAVRIMLKAQEDLNEVSKEVRKFMDAGEEIPADVELRQIEAASRAQATLSTVIGNRSETARALNAAKIAKQALDTADSTLQAKALKIFGGDKKKAKEVLKRLSMFDPDDNLGKAKFLREITPSTPMQKVEEYWYNSVLSNVATHLVNNEGNAMAAILSVPERVIAGQLDAGVDAWAALFGKEYKRVRYSEEALQQISGIKTGLANGVRRFWHVMKNGISETDVNKLENVREQAIKGPIGTAINIPSRALVAEDEFWKAINYDMELKALVRRTALNENLSGAKLMAREAELMANPTPQLVEQAADFAQGMTFQSESDVAQALTRFRDVVKVNIPYVGEIRPLRFILPFIRTPVNVVKYGLERTPLGFIGAAGKAVTGKGKEEVIDATARAIMGSAITVPLAMYALQGKITGAAPSDRKEKDAFYAEGKLPWSIKIGDQWIEYSRIEPLNSMLSQIAILKEAFENDEATYTENAAKFTRDVARNIADRTFMEGLGNLMDAIEDPERFGQKFITNIAGGFIPSFIAAGARSTDDTVRNPKTIQEGLMARIPGLSQNVTPLESQYEEGGNAVRHTNEGFIRNVASNFLGHRTSKDTGKDIVEPLKEVREIRSANKSALEQRNEQAALIVDEIKAAGSKEKAREILKKHITQGTMDEDLIVAVKRKLKESGEPTREGIEQDLKNSSHKVRAEFILSETENMGKDEARSYIKKMIEKKIITKDTLKEIAEMRQSQQFIAP